MRLVIALLAAASALSTISRADALGPRRANGVNKQAAVGAYGRAVYPKYYWGFHAREFQDVGVPNGDKGIRSGGLSFEPW